MSAVTKDLILEMKRVAKEVEGLAEKTHAVADQAYGDERLSIRSRADSLEKIAVKMTKTADDLLWGVK